MDGNGKGWKWEKNNLITYPLPQALLQNPLLVDFTSPCFFDCLRWTGGDEPTARFEQRFAGLFFGGGNVEIRVLTPHGVEVKHPWTGGDLEILEGSLGRDSFRCCLPTGTIYQSHGRSTPASKHVIVCIMTQNIWSNYSDLTRPDPWNVAVWCFLEGKSPAISGKSSIGEIEILLFGQKNHHCVDDTECHVECVNIYVLLTAHTLSRMGLKIILMIRKGDPTRTATSISSTESLAGITHTFNIKSNQMKVNIYHAWMEMVACLQSFTCSEQTANLRWSSEVAI